MLQLYATWRRCFVLGFFCGILLSGYSFAYADEVTTLRAQISSGNARLDEIDAEIAKYQKELNKIGSEKSTLKDALSVLEVERKKIAADVAYTEKNISVTNLEIQELGETIEMTEERINTQKRAIQQVIREMNEYDAQSPIEVFLSTDTMGEFWHSFDELLTVRERMQTTARVLADTKEKLSIQKNNAQEKRVVLTHLKSEYSDQQGVLQGTLNQKASLLEVTQSKESEYQKMLANKKAAREAIETEVRDYESRLQFILDPNSIPTPGTAVFDWPVASVYITQYFGGTEFAKQHASVYAGRPYHPGVDFGASAGTKIYAPAAGTVRATGDTDSSSGCLSWGKWTLIDHNNGLSTLYAHQSQHAVSPGDVVEKGDVIGYVGSTGYSTGAHLHLTVYVKSAVSVKTFGTTGCGLVPRPTAPTDAYLDPMLYLPSL